MVLRCLAVLAIMVLMAGKTVSAEQASGKDARMSAFDIEAHRGGRALFPENTLVSFANALAMGVDTLELDVGVTRDGVLVISHERGLNPDLARGADGKYVAAAGIPFVQLSLDEVKQFDVGQIRPGSTYAAQFPDQHAVPGTRIPTLKELIDLVRRSGDGHVRLNIETKIDPNHPDESPSPERFVALLLDLLRTEKFEDRVMVQSFDWRTLQLVQKLASEIPTVYLTVQGGRDPTVFSDRASEWTAGFNPAEHGRSIPRTIKAAGGAIWSPYARDLTPALVAESHALGLKVVVWTANQPEDIAHLIEMGVDGIISDRPDLLRKVAGEQGIALPAAFPVTP
jgi:glycerophosphoryl diester phosphodiesterase